MAEKADTVEGQAEDTSLNIFITGGGHGVGLALTKKAVAAGHKVFATARGSEEAFRIREAGGLPIYPDLTDAGEIGSVMSMARADVVVNCAPQALGGIPQVTVDYDSLLDELRIGTQALVSVAGQLGVQKFLHLSYAFLYDTNNANEATSTKGGNAFSNAAQDAEESVMDGGLPAYVVRAGYIYGKSHNATQKIQKMLHDGDGVIKGNNAAVWVHEDDLATALLNLIAVDFSSTANIVNIADDVVTSPDEFLRIFGTEYGVGEPNGIMPLLANRRTHKVQRALMAMGFSVSTEKAQKLIDWKPQYPTPQAGIERILLEWRAAEADEILSDTPASDDESKALATT